MDTQNPANEDRSFGEYTNSNMGNNNNFNVNVTDSTITCNLQGLDKLFVAIERLVSILTTKSLKGLQRQGSRKAVKAAKLAAKAPIAEKVPLIVKTPIASKAPIDRRVINDAKAMTVLESQVRKLVSEMEKRLSSGKPSVVPVYREELVLILRKILSEIGIDITQRNIVVDHAVTNEVEAAVESIINSFKKLPAIDENEVAAVEDMLHRLSSDDIPIISRFSFWIVYWGHVRSLTKISYVRENKRLRVSFHC